MDYARTLELPAHKRGDRWIGIAAIGPITFDGAPPLVTLARVRMQFRLAEAVYKLDSDATDRDAPITIVDAATWEATILPVEEDFLPTAGTWDYDIEFYGEDQGPVTLIKGTMLVYEDITK